MDLGDLNRKQKITIILIAGLLFGLIGLPIFLQEFYGIDAITTTFAVIVVYAVLNWYLKRR